MAKDAQYNSINNSGLRRQKHRAVWGGSLSRVSDAVWLSKCKQENSKHLKAEEEYRGCAGAQPTGESSCHALAVGSERC